MAYIELLVAHINIELYQIKVFLAKIIKLAEKKLEDHEVKKANLIKHLFLFGKVLYIIQFGKIIRFTRFD